MKIKVNKQPQAGVPLHAIKFGVVVQRFATASSPEGIYYLVVATMDGTGNRALVNLRSGNINSCLPQDEPVIPVDAHVVIGDEELAERPKLENLATMLEEWSRDGRLTALRMTRGEPELNQLLRAAVNALRNP